MMRTLAFTSILFLGVVIAACMADADAATNSPRQTDAAPNSALPADSAADARTPAEASLHKELHQPLDPSTRQHVKTSTRPNVLKSRSRDFKVFGYHAWWMRDLWQSYDLELLDKVMYFELRAGLDGRIAETNGWPGSSSGLADALRRNGVAIVPTIAVLDPPTFRSIFGSPATMDILHDDVMQIVENANADGVHLNIEIFEPVAAELRHNLTRFVTRLRASLTTYKSGSELSIFTPGFDHAEAYDEAALASVADYLIVQGYDMHWVNGPEAGPLAPTAGWNGANWDAIVARYLAAGVPAHKIVITVPYYGYEWPTVSEHPGAATRGDARTITYAPVDADYLPLIQINALERSGRYGTKRDPVTQTPYYVYRGDDGWYQGWYEDEQSLRAKYRFVREHDLAGIAIFLLGYDGGKLMSSLN